MSLYAAAAGCGHASRTVDGLITNDGIRVKPFAIFTGTAPAVDAKPIQFIGDVYQEIAWEGVDELGHQVAELSIVRFHMEADDPVLGHLIISHDATRPGVRASLRAVNAGKKFPVIHSTFLHILATASTMPGIFLQNQGPPLQFISEELPEWPPKNRIYRLPVNVAFELRHPTPKSDLRETRKVVFKVTAGAVVVSSLARDSRRRPGSPKRRSNSRK